VEKISIVEGKNPVGESAAKQNPITIAGVDGDNKVIGMVLNSDGSITAKLAAGTAIIGKFIPVDTDGDEKFTNTNPASVKVTGSRTAPVAHRAAITAADKAATVTITAADQPATAGSLTAVSHGIGVAPGNIYGSAGVSALVTVTPTVNKSIDITIPQATGATYYEVFVGTTPTAPLLVARITEGQRATGCAITAVGTVGEGGSAGVVNVQVVGTGQASTSVNFAYNNAYIPAAITALDCTGKTKAYIHTKMSLTDNRTLPTLVIVPFLQNGNNDWYAGQAQTVLIMSGTAGQALNQVLEIDVNSAEGMIVLIDTLTGQDASINIDVELF